MIRAAATLGHAVSNDMLVRICDLPSGVVMESISEILDVHLLREHDWLLGRYEFPHSLVRNAVYLGTPDDERVRLHRCVAEALEATDVDVRRPRDSGELAHHFAAAQTSGSAAKAVDYSRAAGDEAMTRLAFTEATEWYERALAHWLDAGRPEAETGALFLALGRAYEADREFVSARQRYLAGAVHARAAGDQVLFADLAIAATGPWSSGRDFQDDAREVLEAAVETSGTLDTYHRIRLLSRLATSLYYDDPAREAILTAEALALAETLSDETALTEAHLAQHLSLTHEPTARVERLATSEAALGLATSNGSAPAMLRVGRELLTDLLENGECERFDAALDGYEGLAKQACSPYDLYWSMALRATQATLYGDLSLAEQLARGAGILGAELHEDASGLEMLQRFVVRYQQGRLVELVSPLRAIDAPRPAYRAGSALAAIACAEAGRHDEAERIARWAIGPDGHAIARDSFWLGAHALFAGAVSTTGDEELAHRLYALLLPCADHVVTFGAGGAVLGCTHHWLGLLARALSDFDLAAAHLREAEKISTRIGAPYWRAQAQVDLAETLRRRGDEADAALAQDAHARGEHRRRTAGLRSPRGCHRLIRAPGYESSLDGGRTAASATNLVPTALLSIPAPSRPRTRSIRAFRLARQRALDCPKVRVVVDLRHLEPVDDDVEDLLRDIAQTRLHVDRGVTFSREAITLVRELERDVRARAGLHERARQLVHCDADILDIVVREANAIGDRGSRNPRDAQVHGRRG